jgi:ketosteroid isomerase-like protein
MAGDENTIAQTYSNYVQAFQTLDRRAVLPYCHVPCMFVSPQGVRIMETPSEVESLFNRVMEGLKARGFAQSRLTDFEVKQMSEDIALVSVSRVRYKTDGSELEQLGETYTFRKTEKDWKIVAAMVHDPDTVLRLC